MTCSVATIEPPSAQSSPPSPESKPVLRKHGKVLIGWLILVMIGNLAFGLLYLLGGPASFPSIPPWAVYTLGAGAMVNFVLALLILAWKKLAFYGLCVIAGVGFVVNISIGVNALAALTGAVLGPVIIYLLLRPEWNLLD